MVAAFAVFLIGPLAYGGQDEEPFTFAHPTWSPAALEEWIERALANDLETAQTLRELHHEFVERWALATTQMRRAMREYREAMTQWMEDQVGPQPASTTEQIARRLQWKHDRLALEEDFVIAVAEVLDDHEAWNSWTQFMADWRRRKTFAEMEPVWLLPLPDLIGTLEECNIDLTAGVATVADDYRVAVDRMIISIQRRYYSVEAVYYRALMANASSEELEQIDTRPQTIRPLYQLNLTFADAFLGSLQGAERAAFEEAWNGLWFEGISTPTPADAAIKRMREWLHSNEDHRIVNVDRIANEYETAKRATDNMLVQANPPAQQIRNRFDPDPLEPLPEDLLAWLADMENETYGVWRSKTAHAHTERLRLICDTCERLTALLGDDTGVPADVLFLLSAPLLVDGGV